MASKLVDLVKIIAASTGTGAITLGGAAPGYRGKEILQNGETYSYAIQQGENYEFGHGIYLSSGNQFVRTPTDSSNGGAPLDLQPNAAIAFIALSADIGGATPGPAGPPGNSVATLSALKALDVSTTKAALVGSTVFGWQVADFTALIDEVNYVASNSVAVTIGAWVRQDAETIAFRSSLGGPYLSRNLSQVAGETVSAKTYVIGDGSADDGDRWQELISLRPGRIKYPDGCEIATTKKVLLYGNQEHAFEGSAGITGDVADYAAQGLGYPDLASATVTAAIAKDAVSFSFSGTLGLAAGDDFYLYDSVADDYDINVVRSVVGGTVYTKRPILLPFATPANVRIYRLTNRCQNVRILGGTFRNLNASASAQALAFLNATDIQIVGAQFTQTGGIGLGFNVSSRLHVENVFALKTGGVSLGFRAVKDFTVRDFNSRFPAGDESLTFFKQCGFGTVSGIDIEQYLYGEAPSGNAGLAGNCILTDTNCSDISFSELRLRGSATYSFFVTNSSQRISVDNFDIALSNLGGIRIASGSNSNFVGRGRVSDVINAADPQQSGIATSAIQDDAGCTGNELKGGYQAFARIAGSINVRQSGMAPANASYGAQGASQANSAASDVAGVVADLNSLLSKLRTAGLLAP